MNIFYHTLYYCFYNSTFFRLTSKIYIFTDDTNNNEQDLSETAEQYKVNMGQGRVITVHTSALDEKTTAMQMLGTMAREMKELFAPYVQDVMNVAAPLMLFSSK